MDSKKIIMAISALVALSVMGVFGYARFLAHPRVEEASTGVPPSVTQPAGSTTVNSAPAASPEDVEALSEQLTKAAAHDQDLDGLSDEEEKKSGTSPTASDTDNDGLLDKDEIMIYKTNPLKADTDADGKKDGYEVRRNLNPAGPGQLTLPAVTSSLKTTSTLQ